MNSALAALALSFLLVAAVFVDKREMCIWGVTLAVVAQVCSLGLGDASGSGWQRRMENGAGLTAAIKAFF